MKLSDWASASFLFLPLIALCLSGCIQDAPSPSVQQTTTLLTRLLDDENPEVRTTAAESLGKIGDSGAIPSILPLVTDPVPAVRRAATQALGRIASPSNRDVIDALALALEDSDDGVKQAASLAIGEIEPSSKQLGPVVRLVQASDREIRRAAVLALLQTDAKHWLSEITPALHDADSEVRQGAVAVLGESGGSTHATEIRKRLIEDPSPAVRTEAVYRLGKVGGLKVRLALERAFGTDLDPGVRRWAEAGLKSWHESD